MDQRRRRFLQQAFRRTGIALLAAPNLVGLMQAGKKLHAEEILSLSATSLPILWRFYFDGQLAEVQHTLPGYISQLALLVRQSADYQQRAARLVSQAHQLACTLALQELDYGSALIHVDQALQSADIVDDMNAKAASLIRKALVYRYVNRTYNPCPNQILLIYQEAEHSSTSIRCKMALEDA